VWEGSQKDLQGGVECVVRGAMGGGGGGGQRVDRVEGKKTCTCQIQFLTSQVTGFANLLLLALGPHQSDTFTLNLMLPLSSSTGGESAGASLSV
jgi:hypothetical protein